MPIRKMTTRGRRLREEDIASVEKELRARLPDAYRKFMLELNGGRPEPSTFGKNRIPSILAYFCSIRATKKYYDLLEAYQRSHKELPAQVIPIGEDECGNFICLATKGRNRGKVYFWDHEGGAPEEDPWLKFRHLIFPDEYEEATDTRRKLDWPGHPDLTLIADSFDEFLDSFHDVDQATMDAEVAKRHAENARSITVQLFEELESLEEAATPQPTNTRPKQATARTARAKTTPRRKTGKPRPPRRR